MTKAKSSCRRLKRQRISSSSTVAAALAGVVCLLGVLGVCAPAARAGDTAPEWMRTAAAQTLPEYSKETSAVVLYDETIITVKDNGEIDVTRRHACKLLRSDARDECGYAFVRFDNQTKVSYFRAWTIMPSGGQIQVKDKEAMEVGLGEDFELFSDQRAKVIKFPEANPGSVVGYEYTQRQRPFVFEDEWDIQRTIPTRYARLSITLPPSWEFSNFWANYPDQKPVSTSGNQNVWEVRDVPAIEVEPEMPPREAIAARMGIKYFPSNPAMRQKTTGTWDDIATWYSTLTVNSRTPSPALTQKVTELTAGAKDPLAQMKVLSSYMQRNIRYAAIEIGIGGFQPHNAADIFTHQYGDCKDKATLLSAMLKQVGIDSYYVPIFTDRGVVNPKFPSMNFNHVILAIKLPDSVPEGGLFAEYKSPKFGRLLFFDPTNEYVPLGYLPSYLQDNYGLVVGPNGGEIVELPLATPNSNRLLRMATLKLAPTGGLSGEVNELRFGGPAEVSREQFLRAAPADRQKVVERFLGNSLSSFSLLGASVGNLEMYDQNLTLNYKFSADGYAQNAGDLLILRPRVMGGKGNNILAGKKRLYPIEFEEASRQDDIFDITLPTGYVVDELPKPVDASCPYATYKSEVTMNGNVLRYKRTYTITDVMVPTEHLDEVRDFFRQIDADEKASAVLRRATTASATGATATN
jgi:transglutaminase-like putative cysteine protease